MGGSHFVRKSSKMAAVTKNRKFLNWRNPPNFKPNFKNMVKSFLSYIAAIFVNFTLLLIFADCGNKAYLLMC